MPSLMSPQRILNHAKAHSFSLDVFDFETPIDRTRFFVCPSLTPLYYTEVYRSLTEGDRLRYNQLTAMCFGEMISFFEGTFVSALRTLAARARLDAVLSACVHQFINDEAKHQELWRRLNRLSEPTWYASADRRIVQIPRSTEMALRWFAGRPAQFPVVVWLMLALEEHSMEISRRCSRLPVDTIEPRYRAAYHAHMEEEIRHIHTDFNLLTQLLDRLSSVQFRRTMWLFQRATEAFFLKPKRAAVRVIDQLIVERPALHPCRRPMLHQLQGLAKNSEYRNMMLSPETTPMSFVLLQRLQNAAGLGQ